MKRPKRAPAGLVRVKVFCLSMFRRRVRGGVGVQFTLKVVRQPQLAQSRIGLPCWLMRTTRFSGGVSELARLARIGSASHIRPPI